MKKRALSLFSGGLDSILAVKLIAQQGIEVVGVTFTTPFFSPDKAKKAAESISLPLVIRDITEEHLQIIKQPRYGFGRNMNPCIDCHTLMLKTAGNLLEEFGASFLVTGEVLGQRPMSQTKQALSLVAKRSGYEGLVLRPLSALLLPETIPEIHGLVDRKRLLAIRGRGRKVQMELANQFGISYYPTPAGGCLLTDPAYAVRLRNLVSINPDFDRRDVELLKHGRHFTVGTPPTKVIVGRNQADNNALIGLLRDCDDLLRLNKRPGPVTLIPRGGSEEVRRVAAALCALYGNVGEGVSVEVVCESGTSREIILTCPLSRKEAELIMVR
ncbi:MAG: tRNA 4-thiouridine(8) synthase ThiI [Syntrophales bacterium]|nr:tRNA 4-thiouridine(8) synthase ThiI [Syntrophales bacterium]